MNYKANQNRISRMLLTVLDDNTGLFDIQRAFNNVAHSEIAKDLRKLIPDLVEVKIEAESESMDDGTSACCITSITLRYGEDGGRTQLLASCNDIKTTLEIGDDGDEEQLFALLNQFPADLDDARESPDDIREAQFGRLHNLCTDLTEFAQSSDGETVYVLDDLIKDFDDDSETSDEPTEVTTPE